MSIHTCLIRSLKLKIILCTVNLTMLGAVLGTASMAQEASAGSTTDGTIKVSLSDLNLSTAEGVRVAHERVRLAARRMCAKVRASADMSASLNYITCIDEAMANAVAQIDELSRDSTRRIAHNKQ